MNSKLVELFHAPAVAPRWYVATTIGLPLLLATLAVLSAVMLPHAPGINGPRPIPEEAQAGFIPLFAWVFCAAAFAVSFLILLACLPIYLFSKDKERIKRAGGLVKTSLGFIVTSAGGILATFSFK
jgi:hypothetical protein